MLKVRVSETGINFQWAIEVKVSATFPDSSFTAFCLKALLDLDRVRYIWLFCVQHVLNKSLAGFISIQHFVGSLSLLARLKKKRRPEYFDGLFSQIFIKNCSLMLCFFLQLMPRVSDAPFGHLVRRH